MSSPICYIVGAGENCGLDFVPQPEDLVIAADGGLVYLQQAGITPDLLIGDFDSLGWVPHGNQVVLLPKEKDVTDTWAAAEEGIRRGFRCFRLYCCTGGRFEHTIANLQTAVYLTQKGYECTIVDKTQLITAICAQTISFDSSHSGYISVFSHTDYCRDVTIRGLKYTLEHADLTNDYPLGVSNEFIGTESSISIERGTAIVIYDRNLSQIRP